MAPEDVPTVDPDTAERLTSEGHQLIDVRTQEEWDAGHVAGATHIPLDDLPQRLDEVGDDVVTMCKLGGRSGRAAAWLIASGKRAQSMDGGIEAWEAAGKPVVDAN